MTCNGFYFKGLPLPNPVEVKPAAADTKTTDAKALPAQSADREVILGFLHKN
jgi:hypothetical protein